MAVLLPLGGARVDGWIFIRFYVAVPFLNDLLQLVCTSWFPEILADPQ